MIRGKSYENEIWRYLTKSDEEEGENRTMDI